MKEREPCLCGDPECRRCFPRYEEPYFDESKADEDRWERQREREQQENDDGRE